jgi:hypothetical protein
MQIHIVREHYRCREIPRACRNAWQLKLAYINDENKMLQPF